MIARRREIRGRYAEAFTDLPIRFLGRNDSERDDSNDNCWLTTIVMGTPRSADTVVDAMTEQQIEVRHLWKPMHLQPIFAKARSFTNGVSEDLFDRGVTLPSGPGLSDGQVDRVIASIIRVVHGV